MVYRVGMDGLYGRYGWSMVGMDGLWYIYGQYVYGGWGGVGGEDGADLQRISPLSGSEVVTVGSRLLSSLYILYIYIYIDEGQRNQTAGVSNV